MVTNDHENISVFCFCLNAWNLYYIQIQFLFSLTFLDPVYTWPLVIWSPGTGVNGSCMSHRFCNRCCMYTAWYLFFLVLIFNDWVWAQRIDAFTYTLLTAPANNLLHQSRNAELFNSYMQSLKRSVPDRNLQEFWDLLIQGKEQAFCSCWAEDFMPSACTFVFRCSDAD